MTTLRTAGLDDLEPLVDLEADLFGATAWSRASLSEGLAEDGAGRIAIVGEAEGRIRGYGIVRLAGDIADVERIGVARADQRLGIGALLLGSLIDRACDAGATAILLEVAAANAAAIALYERQGFEAIDRRPRYYSDGQSAIVMRLACG